MSLKLTFCFKIVIKNVIKAQQLQARLDTQQISRKQMKMLLLSFFLQVHPKGYFDSPPTRGLRHCCHGDSHAPMLD